MHDVFAAFRLFRKSPGMAVTVVLTIALGIGANVAIFTLVHAVLLRSLPVRDPKALYAVGKDANIAGIMNGLPADGRFSIFSYDLYKHMQQTTPAFEQLAAMQSGGDGMDVRDGNREAKSETTEYVSGNYFSTLGIGPFAGRLLSDHDELPAASPTAVMSYSAWQAEYGSDPGVVGKTFTFQGHPITVVGIAPAGFYGDRVSTRPPAFWLPLGVEPMLEGSFSVLHSPTSNWLFLLGRIRPGINTGSLAAEMTTNLKNWLPTQPSYLRTGGAALIAKQKIALVPGGGGIQRMQQQEGTGLYLLMAISGLVLLVACANVANLLLARGSANRADTSIRMALGAARTRIVRQMLAESILLACVGGLAGVALAYGGTRMILSLAFPNAPQLPIHASPSLPVLGFAFLLSLATGAIFGVVPAWITSHADPAEALRGANRSTRDRASLPQRGLIVFQAALSLILLMGAGLLTRSLNRLENQDFGIQTANRYVVHIDPASAGYTEQKLPALYRALQNRFGATPGIAHVGLALYGPLEQDQWSTGVNIAGRPEAQAGTDNGADFDRVSPQFFASVGQPLIAGRTFTDEDNAASEGVAVVNEDFVKKFFHGENPIGRYFGSEPSHFNSYRIVGVVADAKYVDPTANPPAMFFLPFGQTVTGLSADNAATQSRGQFAGTVILQFKTSPESVDALVRKTLSEIDPNLTVVDLHTMEYQVNGNFVENKLIARLAMLFGLLALVLAAIGLYGVTSYQVARRTSEIGVRMALGANRADILRMVLQRAFLQVGLGLAIGIPVAILGARSIASQLYGVKAYDPTSLLLAIGVLVVAAGLAAWIPALRASRVEPVRALRSE